MHKTPHTMFGSEMSNRDNFTAQKRQWKVSASIKYQIKKKKTLRRRRPSKKKKNCKKKEKLKISLLDFLTNPESKLVHHKKLVNRFKVLRNHKGFPLNLNKCLVRDYNFIKLVKKHEAFGEAVILDELLRRNRDIKSQINEYTKDRERFRAKCQEDRK